MNERDTNLLREALIEFKKCEQQHINEISEPYMPAAGDETTSMPSDITADVNSRGYKWQRKPVRLVAAVVALVLCAFMLVSCAFIPQIREFIVKVYEDFVELISNDPASEAIEELYMPSYIPDGYSVTSYGQGNINRVDWACGNDVIQFKQGILGSTIFMDNTDYEVITVGNYTVHTSEKAGQRVFVWEDDKYCYVLNTPSTLSDEDVFMIIESVRFRETFPELGEHM